ncbi:hypothetical protein E05_22270 [Plautia stali symbiont]|nr:hypothetical protein E05_22270 [Plautia stali symbiont]
MNSPFATGVYGSGAGTDIDTHGATLNIASFASGLNITDGACAISDAATRIHLNGSDARVAIADGNRYTLQGNVVNPNTQFDPNTLLINLIGREIFKRETCDKCGSTWDKLDLSGTGYGN